MIIFLKDERKRIKRDEYIERQAKKIDRESKKILVIIPIKHFTFVNYDSSVVI